MAEIAHVTVERIHHYRDTDRANQVRIDGDAVGKVKDEKELTLEVAPGTHHLRVRLMWLQSPSIEFTIQEGEHLRFRTGPNGGILQAWRIYFAPQTAMFLEAV